VFAIKGGPRLGRSLP